jgi:hypothetical protein
MLFGSRSVRVGMTLMLGVGALAAVSTSSTANEQSDFASYNNAVPGVAPADAGATAVYLDEQGQLMTPGGEESDGGTQADAIGCTPVSGRDNPHRSSTGVAVSGHGWWNRGTCSGDRADVLNCLYEWYTDNTWRLKDCSVTWDLRPRSEGGGRSTARSDCDNTAVTSWRNHVDVDVQGEIDTAETPFNQADVNCRVF